VSRVSFDFDGVLDRETVQRYAKKLIEKGHEVWVVTTRYDDHMAVKLFNSPDRNADLWKVTEAIGIPRTNVVFTNFEWKDSWFLARQADFIWHLDDTLEELSRLSRLGPMKAISMLSGSWEGKCEKFLARRERSR